jgi:hypothetical protein
MRRALGVAIAALACGCSLAFDVGSLRGSSTADAGPDAVGDASGDAGCGDLQTSKTSCGRCGHDCLGGDCKAGVCQPFSLAAQQPGPSSIAIDGRNAYFIVDGGGLRRVALAGGSAEPVGATSVPGLANLRVDGARLVATAPMNGFVSVLGADAMASASEIGLQPLVTFTGGNAYDFAVDASAYSLAQAGACMFQGPGCLRSAPKTPSPPVTDLESVGADARLAVADAGLVIATGTSLRLRVQGSAKTIAMLPGPATSIATSGASAYVAIPSLGLVLAVALPSGPLTTLASALPSPRLVVAAAGGVYWVGDQGIAGCDPTRCQETTVAYATARPTSLAADARALYWPEVARAGIFAVAR